MISAILRAGLLTAIIDGAFSGVLAVFFYQSGFARLWQGVASTVLGPTALDGGVQTMMVGIAMHIGVAFTWSAVFVLLLRPRQAVARILASPNGWIKTGALYGPFIWMVMSLIVIPTLTGRPPSITFRWWVQFIGHAPFVGMPIAWISSSVPASGAPPARSGA
jgi:hypothetical protein